MTALILIVIVAGLAGAMFAFRKPLAESGPRLPKPIPCPLPVPVPLKDQPFDLVLGGRLVGPFILTEEAVQARMAVLGASGSGKSKFLFLLFAALIAARKGFLLIDPHGDLAHALLAYCASRIEKGDVALVKRLHFLEPGRRAFTLDPFANAPRGLSRSRYQRWLKTRVDRVCRNLMRRVSEADQEVMLRLRRWMHNIVTACGVALDDRNTHVGLHQALVFADPQHPEFEGLLARVAPFLSTEVRRDFEKLRETKRALDQEKWLESSINRFRDILSPLTAELFAPRPHSLSMLDIIRDGGHVLASLQELRDFSHDEKQVIGGLLIDEVLCAKQAEEELPEEQRVPFILGIDEFGEFLGEDLLRAFGAVRKYKLSIIVAGQDLSTLEKGELDLAAKVLSQCHTKLIFNMTWPDDLDVLSRNVGYGNISFDELIHEIERHGGYDFFRVIEPSLSLQQGRNHSDGGARGATAGGGKSVTHQESSQENWAQGATHTETRADGQGIAESNVVNSSAGTGETLDIHDGELRERFPVHSTQVGNARGTVLNRTTQTSAGDGTSLSHGGGRGVSDALAESSTWGRSETQNWSDGVSEGVGLTLACKLMSLARVVREKQRTGQLEMSVADQFERLKQQIHGLRPRFCLVKLPDEPAAFLVEVALVKPIFPSPGKRDRAVAALKGRLASLRPYYVPEESLDADGRPPAPLPASPRALPVPPDSPIA